MSKAVRIREHLYDEIARLAKEERRSILAQLEVLLEQALRLRSSDAAVGDHAVSGSAVANSEEDGGLVAPTVPRPERAASDSHFRPDPK